MNDLKMNFVGNNGVGDKQSWVSKVIELISLSVQNLRITQRVFVMDGLKIHFTIILIQVLNTHALSAPSLILDAVSGKLNLMIKSL